ncbi:FecR domain-containing protein [Pseudomonas turukhanskensis]|uniref:Sensor n=1 Tax=Pseudomonas turukhanskensis TaxID=1806536 RepID=A0A9W6K4T4_9PSED|nr:FecR domain-containing protein [Pseudomonas turukhanskensis]GLK88251.1 sensor [Pseudomonas turukhanskensis]
MASPAARPMPKNCLEMAVHWYVQLNDGDADDNQRQAWQRWVAESPDHARAWARVEKLQRQLHGVPMDLALPVLTQAGVERRLAMKSLLVFAALGFAGLGYEFSPLGADYLSATGQRRQVLLPDGGRLDLNTDTQVDVHYSSSERLITLRHGEVRLLTAPDNLVPVPRPLVVATVHGRVRALGTDFNVRLGEKSTTVTVLEHAVEVRSRLAPDIAQRVSAGEQLQFNARQLRPVRAADLNVSAWSRGMLVAIDWRLGDFIAELSRYRSGHLSCAPQVAELRVSGAFTLDDTDAVLANLTASLPVKLRTFSRYWVRVEA